jgi:hypothetical protein
MGWKLRAALLLAAGVLAGCEPYPGPTATCFNFVEGEACQFEALPAPGVPGRA